MTVYISGKITCDDDYREKFAMAMSEKVEKQLRDQIEKMKCCENCKHYNTTEEYVLCNISHITSCENLDKWEIKE